MTRRNPARILAWIALLPLVLLTAVCLIKYAVWTAVVSGDSSQHAVVTHASRMANFWLSGLITAELTATILFFLLLPARLRLLRLIIPVLSIPLLSGGLAYGLVILGRHLH